LKEGGKVPICASAFLRRPLTTRGESCERDHPRRASVGSA
jgi:hypothetical protein